MVKLQKYVRVYTVLSFSPVSRIVLFTERLMLPVSAEILCAFTRKYKPFLLFYLIGGMLINIHYFASSLSKLEIIPHRYIKCYHRILEVFWGEGSFILLLVHKILTHININQYCHRCGEMWYKH